LEPQEGPGCGCHSSSHVPSVCPLNGSKSSSGLRNCRAPWRRLSPRCVPRSTSEDNARCCWMSFPGCGCRPLSSGVHWIETLRNPRHGKQFLASSRATFPSSPAAAISPALSVPTTFWLHSDPFLGNRPLPEATERLEATGQLTGSRRWEARLKALREAYHLQRDSPCRSEWHSGLA